MSQIRDFFTTYTGQLIMGGSLPILAVAILVLLSKNRRHRF
ncbi:hypothetical protein [Brucella pituitosa]|nr:hypothetical protein [Brucella pituitosa]